MASDPFVIRTKQINEMILHEPKLDQLIYDKGVDDDQLKMSQGPGNYMLFQPEKESCNMNFPGMLDTRSKGVLSRNIDIESKLRTLDIKNSKCPEKQYNPLLNCIDCDNCNSGLPCDCNHCKKRKENQCDPQFYAQLSVKDKNVRSAEWNRFEPICVDVQKLSRFHDNSYIGINSRILMKDKAKAKAKAKAKK